MPQENFFSGNYNPTQCEMVQSRRAVTKALRKKSFMLDPMQELTPSRASKAELN